MKKLALLLLPLILLGSVSSASASFLPLGGDTSIIENTIQGFCNIKVQGYSVFECGGKNSTLNITHGTGISVTSFQSNQTIWLNATGAVGPQGPTGPQGPQGTMGTTGTAGSQIYTGAGSPSGGLGVDSDFYVNVSNGDYYQKSGGSWVLKGNLTGPQGSMGATGSTGPQGIQGIPGPSGSNATATKINTTTCSSFNFFNAYSNSTGILSCRLPVNTAQVVSADNGESLISSKFNATETKLMTLRNQSAYILYNHNSTSITPSFQFKINSLTCGANSFVTTLSNSSTSTCASPTISGVVTQVNTFTGKVNITAQSGNETVTNSSGTIIIGNGINDVITGGGNQTVTKPFGISKLIDSLSAIVGSADTSKKIKFLNSGMTTGITTTIRNNATTSQGINIPATRQSETFAIRPTINATTPSDPTGTTSTTGVMSGMLAGFTPQVTGRIQIIIEGDLSSLLGADGAKADTRTGTGTSPANGAALSGTVCGKAVQTNGGSAAAYLTPFAMTCQVTGLTIGTHIWIEVGEYAISASTASIKNIVVSVMEI